MTTLHPHRLRGKVVAGEGLAARLGCPTANLSFESLVEIPAEGVYLAVTEVFGKRFPSLLAVGGRKDARDFKIEVHLLDQTLSLIGEFLEVEVGEKLRDFIPWPGEEAMRQMIEQDQAEARTWFREHPLSSL